MEQIIKINDSGELVVTTDNGQVINGKTIHPHYSGTFSCDADTLRKIETVYLGRQVFVTKFRGRYGEYYIALANGEEEVFNKITEQLKVVAEIKANYQDLLYDIRKLSNTKWFKKRKVLKYFISKWNKLLKKS